MPFIKDKRKLCSHAFAIENKTKKTGPHHAVFTVSGDKYIGDWNNNLREGKGTCLTTSLSLYEGDWSKNVREGFGVLSFCQPNKVFILGYRGDWVRGKECGFGAKHYTDGGYFLGHWKNGKRCGYGQMWYGDGAFYNGSWVNDKRHGEGMLVRADGCRYEGSWAFDLKHGKGRFFHLHTGQMQEGIWQQDVCVYSFVIDIPFRQSAKQPTPYPIYVNELQNMEEVCRVREAKAFAEQPSSCTSSKTSIHTKT